MIRIVFHRGDPYDCAWVTLSATGSHVIAHQVGGKEEWFPIPAVSRMIAV